MGPGQPLNVNRIAADAAEYMKQGEFVRKMKMQTKYYRAVRNVLAMDRDSREIFVKWLVNPKTTAPQDAKEWLQQKFDAEVVSLIHADQDQHKTARAMNRQILLTDLIDRALLVSKRDWKNERGTVVPQVAELAELVYNIWTAKSRGVAGSNWRIRRNLYRDALKRGGAECWRKYIQTTLLGYEKSDPQWEDIKWNLKTMLGLVTGVMPDLEKRTDIFSRDPKRKSWSATQVYTSLKNYRD